MRLGLFITYFELIPLSIVFANNETVMMISTEGCTIPSYPLPKEVLQEFSSSKSRDCESETRNLLNSNSTHIWVNKEAYDLYNIYQEDNFYCCYKNFSALENIANIVYAECKEFTTSIEAKHEFVRTECYYNDDKIYDNFYVFHMNDMLVPAFHKPSYNILIIGIENMSRLNFHRTMPLTSNFLKTMGMIEMSGYNKLGDNSLPNLFPLLTGQSFEQLKKKCLHAKTKVKCNFVWNKFKKEGYYTALASDSPAGLLGVYEHNLTAIPTDFYLLPFMRETCDVHRNKLYYYHKCLHSKYYYEILIDYIYGIIQRLKQNKLFGMFWEESISHDHLAGPRVMDESFFDLLTYLNKENYLKNTILIFVSDHGMRWGPIALSKSGYQETRLPLLGIRFPEKFRRKHKLAYKNIQENSRRLTTPFDVHETLVDLIYPELLTDTEIFKRSRVNNSLSAKSSLFLPLSERRSCESLGIDEHWCACYRRKKIITDTKTKTTAANKLLMHIRKLLEHYPQCYRLSIDDIMEVSLVENQTWRTYTVVMSVTPSGGIFESTLVQSGPTWIVSGTVSRLNLYGNQSVCVDDVNVKMYCYCG